MIDFVKSSTEEALSGENSSGKRPHKESRLVYAQNSSVNYYVKPISNSRTQVNGSIVRNIQQDRVILLTISMKKPSITQFFPMKTRLNPCLVLGYKEEYDLTNVRTPPIWIMLAEKEKDVRSEK